MKNDGLDTVEGVASSETEKEAAHGVRARDVGAPATQGVKAPPVAGGGGDFGCCRYTWIYRHHN
jgi:hypothetical protein